MSGSLGCRVRGLGCKGLGSGFRAPGCTVQALGCKGPGGLGLGFSIVDSKCRLESIACCNTVDVKNSCTMRLHP